MANKALKSYKIGLVDADLLNGGTRHPNLVLLKIAGYLNDNEVQFDLIIDPNADIDKIMERKELKRVVWSVVDKLSPDERLIIRDFYKIGYKPFEIAEKLNYHQKPT